ncbi:MAG: hypothetical protein WA673_22100, partial [Candidatus Acidiferrales bacterium]
MRQIAILLALVFFVTINASAQTSISNSQLLPNSYFALSLPLDAPANGPTLMASPFAGASSANTVAALHWGRGRQVLPRCCYCVRQRIRIQWGIQ